jgi:leucyl aminopeptidase
MQFSLCIQAVESIKTNCLVLPLTSGQNLSPLGKQINISTQGLIKQCRSHNDLRGPFAQSLILPAPTGLNAKRLLLINAGEKDKLSQPHWKKLWQAVFAQAIKTNAKSLCIVLDKFCVQGQDASWSLMQAVLTLADCAYQCTQFKSKTEPRKLQSISFHVSKTAQAKLKQSLTDALGIVAGIELTKDLGNTPCNIAVPVYLSKQAQALAKAFPKISCKIQGEKALTRLKMGALLAVGQGSVNESQLIEMHYQGGNAKQAPIVLVGKGVTFDTGGISIKAGPGMEEMKYDMCGAATVFGVIKAIAEQKLPINVIGIVPSVENMPNGNAYKPGDVITSFSGQTIEVLNTDAEGRMILCDALTYAKKFKPSVLIDIATLTGAMLVALGRECSGFYANDETLAKQIAEASTNSADDTWRMPLRENFVKETDSKIADMRNIGSRWGGSNIAAGFLSRFVDKTQHWAHFDIAGVANKSGNSAGATGRPVALLTEFIRARSSKK